MEHPQSPIALGYTVDYDRRQFRRESPGGEPEVVSFDSELGMLMLVQHWAYSVAPKFLNRIGEAVKVQAPK
jgi:hypothetical protein